MHSLPLCLTARSYGVSPSCVNGRNGDSCAINVYGDQHSTDGFDNQKFGTTVIVSALLHAAAQCIGA